MSVYSLYNAILCAHIPDLLFLSVWPFLYIFLFSVVINQKSHIKCIRSVIAVIWLLLHLRPNYIHSASSDIHTDGPRATARARARARG